MKCMQMKFVFCFILSIVCYSTIYSQTIEVDFPKKDIQVGEFFQIRIVALNERINSYDGFPQIDGFQKVIGSWSSMHTSTDNRGKIYSVHSVAQNYLAEKPGKFNIKDFTLQVNGKNIAVKGITVNVQENPHYSNHSYQNNSSRPNINKNNPQEYIKEAIDPPAKGETFLKLAADKTKIYAREQVVLDLSLYIPILTESNYEKHELELQVLRIIQEAMPKDAWKETLAIRDRQFVQLNNGEKYFKFNFFRAAYFPYEVKKITIPARAIKFIKKTPKLISGTDANYTLVSEFVNLSTQEVVIDVLPLPEHPLKDKVSVGVFRLDHQLGTQTVQTGQSQILTYKIVGQGNIATIHEPQINNNQDLDIYPPIINNHVMTDKDFVYGIKSFEYMMIAKKAGTYKCDDLIEWIYFNTSTKKYDTLRSNDQFEAMGATIQHNSIDQELLEISEKNARLESTETVVLGEKSNNWIGSFALIFLGVSCSALIGWRLSKRKK